MNKKYEESQVAQKLFLLYTETTNKIAMIVRVNNINAMFSPLKLVKDWVDPKHYKGFYKIHFSCVKAYIDEILY
jgi:hypothetical protein